MCVCAREEWFQQKRNKNKPKYPVIAFVKSLLLGYYFPEVRLSYSLTIFRLVSSIKTNTTEHFIMPVWHDISLSQLSHFLPPAFSPSTCHMPDI